MVQRQKLANAIKQAVVGTASVAAILTSTGYTYAQDEALEEVTVTGSRIKRPDLESASPLTIINREDIKATGLTDVGDLIQSMPSMSGSPVGTTTNNGGDGSVEIDLRGMGPDRTLTLINGRRVVDGGDYQTIPAAMIERVDILKDGSSASYGADAVAGVVNIITRQDFEGVELEVQTADFNDMDSGAQDTLSIIAGKNFDGGHIVVGAEYVTQEEAYQSDTPWGFMQNSYYIYPEGCESQVTAPYDGTSSGGCYPIGSSRIPEGLLFTAGGDILMNEGDGLVPWDGRFYNYAPVNYIQTPYERTNFFLEGAFDVAENVRAFTEIRANLRESAQELAPVPYDSRFDPAYSGFYTDGDGATVAYNGISEDNYYLNQAGLTEPLVQVRRRMVEAPRRFTQNITQVQAVLGFEGTFEDIDWSLVYNRGYRSRTDQDFGQYVGANLANAMGPSADLDGDGTPECYADINDPGTLIEGCVPINLVGGPNTVTQEMLNYVGADLTDHISTSLETLELGFAGDGFELPGGAMGWAAGIGYIGETFDSSPDSGKQVGSVTGNKGAGTEGSLYNTNAYAEFLLPFLNNGEQSLSAEIGLRYDDYSQFDSETTWQLGVNFHILEDLKLRAKAGTVFRAPTISDLFAGSSDDFPTFVDPCAVAAADLPAGCAQTSVQTDTQVLARVGGNENLTPETGDTFTFGLVWTPDFGDSGDMSLTLDYWEVEIEDGISSLGVQFILDDCYNNLNGQACDLITRNADYSIAQIQDSQLNVAEQGAKGVDLEVKYMLDTDFGQVRAELLWSHLIERTKVAFAGADEEDLSGRYTDPTAEDGGAYAENKYNTSLTWKWNNLTVGWLSEYISELDADTFCNCGPGAAASSDGKYIQKVDDIWYHDLVANYTFDFGTTIAAGITNITDEEPPFIEVGFNATTDPATYRLFGRGYYLRLTHQF